MTVTFGVRFSVGLLETLNSTKSGVTNFFYNMLKISKKKKLSPQSLERYRHILTNPHVEPSKYKGWKDLW